MDILQDDLKLGKEVFKQMQDNNYFMYKVAYHPWSQNCKGIEHQTITISSFKNQIYIESS